MVDFLHVPTGRYPATLAQLRAAHPLTLFPDGFAAAFGDYVPVQPDPMPAHDRATQQAVALAPVKGPNGTWRQGWRVAALEPAQIAQARRAQVPEKVTRRQARQALLLAGLLDAVQPAINAIGEPIARQMAQIEWDDAQEFERSRPIVVQIGQALGLTEEGLDDLFIAAAAL